MTPTDFSQIVSKPNAINERQTNALEKIVDEFPFFQAARALRLKGLYNENSFRYNYALKVAAAYTTDRSILFDFISSDDFASVSEDFHNQKMADINDISVTISSFESVNEQNTNPLKQSILTSIREATHEEITDTISDRKIDDENCVEENNTITEKLDIGTPLEFVKSEKHSFEEWLQLSKQLPIDRSNSSIPNSENDPESDAERQKKNEIIDRFIQTNPKIQPVRSETTIPVVQQPKDEDQSYLMTETLARVYLEQKKYSKAIQAYEILILKYPEKSSFFADRILDIKHLQQNNNIK